MRAFQDYREGKLGICSKLSKEKRFAEKVDRVDEEQEKVFHGERRRETKQIVLEGLNNPSPNHNIKLYPRSASLK